MFCVVVAHVMLAGEREVFLLPGVITDTENASENRFVVQTQRSLEKRGEPEHFLVRDSLDMTCFRNGLNQIYTRARRATNIVVGHWYVQVASGHL